MNTNSQRLLNQSPTAGAFLGCVAWINQYTLPTSILSFVLSVLCKLIPGSIRNALCQTVVLKHSFDVQFLKGNDTILVYQLTGEFVSKILAPVGDALMDMADRFLQFRPFWRVLFSLREFPLGLRKFLFIQTKEVGIGDLLASGEGGKTFKTDIYPNATFACGKWRWFDFAREAGIPISDCIPTNVQCLDLALYGTVLHNLDFPNFGEQQSVIAECKTCLGIGKTIIPSPTFEAWVARIFFGLDPSKECAESQINPIAYFLQNLRIDLRQFWLFFLPARKHLYGIIAGNRFLFLLPSVLTDGKRFVVDPTTKFQRIAEQGALVMSWIQAKLVGHSHTWIIPYLWKLCLISPRINVGVLRRFLYNSHRRHP